VPPIAPNACQTQPSLSLCLPGGFSCVGQDRTQDWYPFKGCPLGTPAAPQGRPQPSEWKRSHMACIFVAPSPWGRTRLSTLSQLPVSPQARSVATGLTSSVHHPSGNTETLDTGSAIRRCCGVHSVFSPRPCARGAGTMLQPLCSRVAPIIVTALSPAVPRELCSQGRCWRLGHIASTGCPPLAQRRRCERLSRRRRLHSRRRRSRRC